MALITIYPNNRDRSVTCSCSLFVGWGLPLSSPRKTDLIFALQLSLRHSRSTLIPPSFISTSNPRHVPLPKVRFTRQIASPISYRMSTVTIVAKTVTTTLRNVVVLQPQPNVRVRSSNRSSPKGQILSFVMGSRREDAGTQMELTGHQPHLWVLWMQL